MDAQFETEQLFVLQGGCKLIICKDTSSPNLVPPGMFYPHLVSNKSLCFGRMTGEFTTKHAL